MKRDYSGKPTILSWKDNTRLKIGKFCSIANDVQILLGGEHRTDWITTFPFPAFKEWNIKKSDYSYSKGDVEIGNDVWIGNGVTILSGVTIGHGAVIGAKSVVTKNVDNYEIVGGNPARHIRYRFNQQDRKKLLKLKWWDLSDNEIEKLLPILLSNNINKL